MLAAGCHRHGEQEPYAPLVEALAHHLQVQTPAYLQANLVGCAWLVRLLPELAGALAPLPAQTLAPEQERRLLFAAVARLLINITDVAGILLVLDDLQWAGPDALDLLAALLRAGPASLRIVGAYRETELSPDNPFRALLADLAQTGLVRQHTVGPLDRAEAAALFQHLLLAPDHPAGAEPEQGVVVEHALERAAGTPFFLVSYAQTLKLGSREAVPWDIAQGVRQRVGLLPGAGQEILGAAAIMGRRSPWALLTAVAGQAEEAGLAGVEAACRAGLLLEDGEDGYIFAHQLIQEVVESDLGVARRAFLHRRVAEALQDQPGGATPEVLAYHYAQSGAEEKATAYLEQAGDAATTAYAHAAAARHYRSALDHLATEADQARVGLKLGTVLTAAGHHDEALAALERAAGQYRAAGDWEGEARDIALLGEVHFRRGTVPEGLARVLAALDSLPSSAYSGAAHLHVALALLGQRGELLAEAQRAAELARLAHHDRILATAEALVGYGLLLSHRPEEALHLYERLIPSYEAAGDIASLCLGLTRCAHAHAALGAFREAQGNLERALAAAEQINHQPLLTEVLELIGWHALVIGEWRAAEGYIGRLEEIARSLGADRLPVALLLLRGSLALYRGEWPQATEDFEEAERVALGTQDPVWRAVQDKLAARDLATGHPEAAVYRTERFGNDLDSDAAWGRLVDYAEAHLRVGNLERAEEIVAQALARFQSRDDRLRQTELLRVQGMLLAEQERWQEAEAAFAEAISLAHRLPYPYLEAGSLYEMGTMLARRGDVEGGSSRLDEALEIFRRLGARKDVERTELALAGLARKEPDHVRDHWWSQGRVALDGDRQEDTGAPPGPAALLSRSHNLPAPLSSFIGRERELARLNALLREDARLVTVVGSGGMGKTRLALAAAWALRHRFADGVWWVPLAGITPGDDPALQQSTVAGAIAAALGLTLGAPSLPLHGLAALLHERAALLVLDNCEQLPEAGVVVRMLLEAAPQLQVLATAREPLGLEGEVLVRLEGLPVPPVDAADPGDYAGVRLFVERAARRVPDWGRDDAELAAAGRLCRLLDGLPLGIELAAHWVGHYTPDEIGASLQADPNFLEARSRDLPDRHRSLRAVFDYAWQLLSEPERQALARLSVFRGSVDRTAAEVVAGMRATTLVALVDKSLVRRAGVGRYSLQEQLRQFAAERLATREETIEVSDRHASYYLTLAEKAAPELTGPDEAAWLEHLDRDLDNLRAVLRGARERGQIELGLRLASALTTFWHIRGQGGEGREWLNSLITEADAVDISAGVLARSLAGAGALANTLGDQRQAVQWLERGVALYREVGDPAGTAHALNTLGGVAFDEGNLPLAIARYQQCVALARAGNDPGEVARALANQGEAYYHQNDLASATTCYAEALPLARRAGRTDIEAYLLGDLGNVARRQGNLAQAGALHRQALTLKQALGHQRQIAITLEDLAGIAAVEGKPERAAGLLGAASRLRATIGTPQPVPERLATEQMVASARSVLGEEAWSVAVQAGSIRPLAEVIAKALDTEWETSRAASPITAPADG